MNIISFVYMGALGTYFAIYNINKVSFEKTNIYF